MFSIWGKDFRGTLCLSKLTGELKFCWRPQQVFVAYEKLERFLPVVVGDQRCRNTTAILK